MGKTLSSKGLGSLRLAFLIVYFLPVGFPEESETFCTLNDISLLNRYLWVLSKNAG
jgi:hypothetical protein